MNKTENNLIAANLFTLKNELKTMLDNYDFDAKYTLKDVIVFNWELIEEYKSKGVPLKEVCVMLNKILNKDIKYNSFIQAYLRIKETSNNNNN